MSGPMLCLGCCPKPCISMAAKKNVIGDPRVVSYVVSSDIPSHTWSFFLAEPFTFSICSALTLILIGYFHSSIQSKVSMIGPHSADTFSVKRFEFVIFPSHTTWSWLMVSCSEFFLCGVHVLNKFNPHTHTYVAFSTRNQQRKGQLVYLPIRMFLSNLT